MKYSPYSPDPQDPFDFFLSPKVKIRFEFLEDIKRNSIMHFHPVLKKKSLKDISGMNW